MSLRLNICHYYIQYLLIIDRPNLSGAMFLIILNTAMWCQILSFYIGYTEKNTDKTLVKHCGLHKLGVSFMY